MTRLLAAAILLLPLASLDPKAVGAYEAYIANVQEPASAAFAQSGKLWLDDQPGGVRDIFNSGKAVVEVQTAPQLSGAQIHHTVGAIRIRGGTIESVHAQLQNYAGYQTIYKPDVVKSSGELLAGSTPDKQHYKVNLQLLQGTLWIEAGFEGVYDSHYTKLSPQRSETRSRSTSIREYKEPHNVSAGLYPEGEDHGFLWRTNTWWRARERDGGVDLELTNISLTKPAPMGTGWWASKKSRQTVENLLNQTREAVEAASGGGASNK